MAEPVDSSSISLKALALQGGYALWQSASKEFERVSPRRLDRSTVKNEAREIKEIQAELRGHGVVRATGRPIPGVNAFSAAVFDHEGNVVLVITALGHEDNFPAGWDSDVTRAVRQAAADVSLRLGYRAKETTVL